MTLSKLWDALIGIGVSRCDLKDYTDMPLSAVFGSPKVDINMLEDFLVSKGMKEKDSMETFLKTNYPESYETIKECI